MPVKPHLIAIACALALSASAATAQNAPANLSTQVTAEQARAIAANNGVVQISEIELDDGKWEIEGRDQSGREIEIDIDARTGAIIKKERD
jgi:uncharacterized membrane protein YkoI